MSMSKKPIHAAGTPRSYLSLLFHAVFPTAEVVRVMAQSAFNSVSGWLQGKAASPLPTPLPLNSRGCKHERF